MVLTRGNGSPRLLVLDSDNGELLDNAEAGLAHKEPCSFFTVCGRLCVVRDKGIFRYRLHAGLGSRLVPGEASPRPTPVLKGDDLYYVRDHEVVVAQGFRNRLMKESDPS